MTPSPNGIRYIDDLEHRLEASRLARSYSDGLKKADFLEDRKAQQAVVLNILILGEAATKLSNEYPEIISNHPELPWKQIRGMRNRMAHGYFEIDLGIVWETVQQSLPDLEQKLLTLIEEVR